VRWDSPLVMSPAATVADALRVVPAVAGFGIVVAERGTDGTVEGAGIRGILPASRLATALPNARLGDLVHTGVPSLDGEDITDGRHAFYVITEADAEAVTIIDHGRLVGTLTARSALRSPLYAPAVDADGRLALAAAVGINADAAEKA